jgi:hypothetical protein
MREFLKTMCAFVALACVMVGIGWACAASLTGVWW